MIRQKAKVRIHSSRDSVDRKPDRKQGSKDHLDQFYDQLQDYRKKSQAANDNFEEAYRGLIQCLDVSSRKKKSHRFSAENEATNKDIQQFSRDTVGLGEYLLILMKNEAQAMAKLSSAYNREIREEKIRQQELQERREEIIEHRNELDEKMKKMRHKSNLVQKKRQQLEGNLAEAKAKKTSLVSRLTQMKAEEALVAQKTLEFDNIQHQMKRIVDETELYRSRVHQLQHGHESYVKDRKMQIHEAQTRLLQSKKKLEKLQNESIQRHHMIERFRSKMKELMDLAQQYQQHPQQSTTGTANNAPIQFKSRIPESTSLPNLNFTGTLPTHHSNDLTTRHMKQNSKSKIQPSIGQRAHSRIIHKKKSKRNDVIDRWK